MARDTCYYDGQCGLCQRSARTLRRLDWLGRLRFTDLTAAPPGELPMDPALALQQGMPMLTANGRFLIGFPAVRRALMRTPLGALLTWPLYLPGLSHLATAIYGHIAANRSRSCSVSPIHRPPPHPTP